jgi:hypothetical protein
MWLALDGWRKYRLIQNLVPDDIEHVLHLKGDYAILKSAITRCIKVRADMMITEN